MINYAPQSGSTPGRVVEHLRSLPPGTELTTAVLADALDLDAPCVPSCLDYAVKHGFVIRDKREGRIYWRLGDGVPLAPAEDDDPIVQRVVPAGAATTSPALARKPARQRRPLVDVPAWPGVMCTPGSNLPPPDPDEQGSVAKTAHVELTPVVSPGKPPKGMRVALWSDGQLQIQRSLGDVILFTVDETRHLVRYLERLGEGAE